jgi:ASC-1-like (ASCH) protein
MKLKIRGSQARPKTIQGKQYSVINGYAKIADLHFWEDNPRIYSLLEDERDTGTISRAEIFEKLSLTKDLQRLRKDIESDGQINEAVWVALDINTQNYVVYEGNTRLAVAMALHRKGKDSKKWSEIEVNVLPDGTDERVMKNFIGQTQLKGKNKWAAFEEVNYLFRETMDIMKNKNASKTEATKMVANFFNLPQLRVSRAVKTVDFMQQYKMSSLVQKKYYAYWQRIVAGNKEINMLRKVFNSYSFLKGKIENAAPNAFDHMMIKQVKEEKQIEAAAADGSSAKLVSYTDNLRLIGRAFETHNDIELVLDLMEEKIDLAEAVRRALEGGVGDAEYKRVKEFADWLMHKNTIKKIRKSIRTYENLGHDLKSISIHARHLSNATMSFPKKKNIKK